MPPVWVNLITMFKRTYRQRLAIVTLLTTVFLSISSSAIGQNRERQQIMADIRMLHEQTMRLQLLIATLDESLRLLSEKLDLKSE